MSECKHKYIFLRQETRNIGYDRNPIWKTHDVYFCEKCLEYAKKEINPEYRESNQYERIQFDKRY